MRVLAVVCWLAGGSSAGLLAAAPEPRCQGDVSARAVAAEVGASRVQLEAGETLALWVTFENCSAQPIANLRLRQFVTGDLPFADECWRNGLPDCVLGDPVGRPDGILSSSLAPGQVLEARARLEADRPGGFVFRAAYSWVDANGAERWGAASLGPVTVSRRPSFFALSNPLLPPVVAGIVVAGLGFFFNAALKRSEQQRAEIQQTWNTMLKDSHDTAQKYYLPFCGAILRFAGRLGAAPTQAARVESFYNFLCVLAASRKVSRGIGGLFLKDRLGEELAVECWQHFKLEIEVALGGRDRLDAALDCGQRSLRSLAHFRTTFDKAAADVKLAPLSTLFEAFRAWSENMPEDQLKALLCFNEILLFEMNRPLERWYGALQEFPGAKLQKHSATLRQVAERYGRAGRADKEQALVHMASSLDRYRAENMRGR